MFSPVVRLLNKDVQPFDTTIASARSCYTGSPVTQVDPDRHGHLYSELLLAGHLTPYAHTTFTFILENVSRLVVYSFLHGHPYYNSDMVSQRYRTVLPNNVVYPPMTGEQRNIYRSAIAGAIADYRSLTNRLLPVMEAAYCEVWPARALQCPDSLGQAAGKLAQEAARYVLPMGVSTHLFYTINALTLLRLYLSWGITDTPTEACILVKQMVDRVMEVDPNFLGHTNKLPLDNNMITRNRVVVDPSFSSYFNDEMGGYSKSRLISYTANAEQVLADAVRTSVGNYSVSTEDAIKLALDSTQNNALIHPMFLGAHDRLTRSLGNVHFIFRKRMSSAEAEQNHRHRGTPVTDATIALDAGVMHPRPFREGALRQQFDAAIDKLSEARAQLLAMGAPSEYVAYLLPNAHTVLAIESGSLLNYYWKWTKRICGNAEYQISETAHEEVAQIRAQMPLIGSLIDKPPCVHRLGAGIRPRCPEGKRFCGVDVWRDYDFEQAFQRRRY